MKIGMRKRNERKLIKIRNKNVGNRRLSGRKSPRRAGEGRERRCKLVVCWIVLPTGVMSSFVDMELDSRSRKTG